MPVAYRIDTSLRVVYSTWEGVVTLKDALAHSEALRADPDFEPDMRQLSDARFATSALSAEGVRRLAKNSPFGRGSRRAILVAADMIYGVSRMYEAQTDDAGTVGVFRDADAALTWLGLAGDVDPDGGDTPEE